jgi:hypothetical protein
MGQPDLMEGASDSFARDRVRKKETSLLRPTVSIDTKSKFVRKRSLKAHKLNIAEIGLFSRLIETTDMFPLRVHFVYFVKKGIKSE